VDGARLASHFSAPPFGWSPDTVRYVVAAMLCAGEVKLKVSGREVTTAGPHAIEGLKTNNSFRTVTVALRQGKPPKEALARAAQRLTQLIGDTVYPLEPDISKAAARHFPKFQQDYAPLAARLDALGLPGAERVQSLNQQIADLLFTDASDATARLGADVSCAERRFSVGPRAQIGARSGSRSYVAHAVGASARAAGAARHRCAGCAAR
jgi:hypothetical protein